MLHIATQLSAIVIRRPQDCNTKLLLSPTARQEANLLLRRTTQAHVRSQGANYGGSSLHGS
jgi:hypothetical protein